MERFSGLITEEVDIQVDKSINYEKTPDMAGDWYNTAIGIGSGEGGEPGKGDDTEADPKPMIFIKRAQMPS